MSVPPDEENAEYHDVLCLTPKVLSEVSAEQIWHHLGGWDENGDSYDTQLSQVERAVDDVLAELIGPHERIRQRLAGHVSVSTTMQFCVGVLDEDMDIARQAIAATIATPKSTRDARRTK